MDNFFEDVFNGVKESYSDVGDFFQDLLGDNLSKTIGEGLKKTSKELSGSSEQVTTGKDSDVLDNEVGPMAQLSNVLKKTDTPKAVDYNTIQREWIVRMARTIQGE